MALNARDQYRTIAASQTDAVLGVNGVIGDLIDTILVVPATTSPGAISVKDGGGSPITLFTGGASSVADLKPFTIKVGMQSITAGGWTITTGASVSVVAVGNFS